ncbi:MAG: glycoside hydrolase family 31 protein [Spirochaetales bacterium]|nr:glycoside hydrolase family 31 protein [Spirochaetales bacterium]
MKQLNDFLTDMADLDLHPEALIWRAGSPASMEAAGGILTMEIPFYPYSLQGSLQPVSGRPAETYTVNLSCPDDEILHLYTKHVSQSPMLSLHDSLTARPLSVLEEESCWRIYDDKQRLRACFYKVRTAPEGWSDQITPAFDSLKGDFYTASGRQITLSAHDQFFPEKVESLPLAFISFEHEGQQKKAALFSFQAESDEHFAGTGERFASQDLRGRTINLENTDAMGVNSRRAYKNVPFYLSSRGYGLFIHSSAHMRLSLADISTRAAQGRIEEDELDLFILGGDHPEGILNNYRKLSGYPPQLPLWSYGTWMSRMTYFSAQEIDEICERLRQEEYPCDLIHIDTGWFETDWVCEWTFSKANFPDPPGFMKSLRDQGYRVSLWQTPNIGEGNRLLKEALDKRYLAPPRGKAVSSSSDFSGQDFGGQIDFTNPEAVQWYQGMIRDLLEKGASVIKTDFGERIQMNADYLNMSPDKLHNLYGLLYQKAAFEETQRTREEGIIWARAGWAGCQRYPLHWGGDAAATWEGMAGSLKGGLHIGLSGFGFWSHDVPGFHGLPEFMNSYPEDDLYMRWTQFAVFSSHLRYHGTSPREPWHFPEIADSIRKWLRLRYYLIPYFMEQARAVSETGFPVLRAMVFHHADDPVCWNIDDQFFCGRDFLVCPVMNSRNERRVYLPEGEWIDFWTGELLEGRQWLERHEIPLEEMPLFVRNKAEIPVYPEAVLTTDDMDLEKVRTLRVDSSFRGWRQQPAAAELGWS